MTVIIFWWLEVYPKKMDGTLHHAHSLSCDMYCPFFSGYTSIHRKFFTVITYHLIQNALKLPKLQCDINFAYSVAIDIAIDVLSVW